MGLGQFLAYAGLLNGHISGLIITLIIMYVIGWILGHNFKSCLHWIGTGMLLLSSLMMLTAVLVVWDRDGASTFSLTHSGITIEGENSLDGKNFHEEFKYEDIENVSFDEEQQLFLINAKDGSSHMFYDVSAFGWRDKLRKLLRRLKYEALRDIIEELNGTD